MAWQHVEGNWQQLAARHAGSERYLRLGWPHMIWKRHLAFIGNILGTLRVSNQHMICESLWGFYFNTHYLYVGLPGDEEVPVSPDEFEGYYNTQ